LKGGGELNVEKTFIRGRKEGVAGVDRRQGDRKYLCKKTKDIGTENQKRVSLKLKKRRCETPQHVRGGWHLKTWGGLGGHVNFIG